MWLQVLKLRSDVEDEVPIEKTRRAICWSVPNWAPWSYRHFFGDMPSLILPLSSVGNKAGSRMFL